MQKKLNVLFLGDRESFYSRELLRGFFSMRSESVKWNFWFLPTQFSIEELENYIQLRKIDGVLSRGLSQPVAEAIAAMEIPSVFIRSAEDADSAAYLNGPIPDDFEIGRLAGEEFSYLNLGYWGFVHWGGVMWSEARRKVFHSYATSLGVSNETLTLSLEARANWKAVEQIADWLEALPKPCGVLACNDEAALDVLHACEILGLSAPDEVAVIGVDNDRLLCESSSPTLTSIDLKVAELGRAAVVDLGKSLGVYSDSMEIHRTPANIVSRESSHRKDRYALVYQKAMDYIEARPLSNTSVEALAKFCGVSRRGLERAFVKCSQSSPAVVMRERKVEAIVDLLQDPSARLETIAQQAGFSDPVGLSNFVKRMTGKPPGELRKTSR
ncbi:substrate-binding domain-containing protein [Rubritalea marina]|uniref:substrate-binding domain-containing protein n=1 Tax=Rubritalea marina TaxID=361055 RepID=UPI00036F2DDF|nr:substrate-binding domain-containing protein [Rubritalea marina]